MLNKVEFLPREHLLKKYVEITGEKYTKAKAMWEKEDIETIADIVEEHLLMEALRDRHVRRL